MNELKVFSPFKTSILIPFAIFLAVFLCFIDPDPPSIPLDSRENPIDCLNIFNPVVFNEGSRIRAKFTMGEFLYYPKNVVHQLLRIVVEGDGISSVFTPKNFWDIQSDMYNGSFCVLQTIGGDLNAFLYCQNTLLASASVHIGSIDIYPVGWSRIVSSNEYALIIYNFTLENLTVIFSIQIRSSISCICLYPGFWINVKAEESSSVNVRNRVQSTINIQEPTIIISSVAIEPFRQMIEVILPYWGSHHQNVGMAHNILLIRNQTCFESFFSHIPKAKIIYPENRMSFSDARVLKAPGVNGLIANNITSPEDDIEDLIEYFLKFKAGLTTPLRSMVANNSIVKGQILVDESLLPLLSNFSFPISNSKLVAFPKNSSIENIISIVSSSQIFISNHIKSMIFALWMKEKATLVDFGEDCLKIGEKISNIARLNLLSKKPTKCQCNRLSCYINSKPKNDKDSFPLINLLNEL